MDQNQMQSNLAYTVRLKKRAILELKQLIYRLRKCEPSVRASVIQELKSDRNMGVGRIHHELCRALTGYIPMPNFDLPYGDITPFNRLQPENGSLKLDHVGGIFEHTVVSDPQNVQKSLYSVSKVLYLLTERDFDIFAKQVVKDDTTYEKIKLQQQKLLYYTKKFFQRKIPHYANLIKSSQYRKHSAAYWDQAKERS